MIGDLWWLMISDNNQSPTTTNQSKILLSYNMMTIFLLFCHAVTPVVLTSTVALVRTEEKFRQGRAALQKFLQLLQFPAFGSCL